MDSYLTIKDFDFKKLRGDVYIYYHTNNIALSPLHDHNYYEFIVMIFGSIKNLINGVETTLVENSITFLRPRDMHYLYKDENDNSNFHFVNVSVSNEVMNDLFVYPLNSYYRSLLDGPHLPVTVSLPQITAKQILTVIKELNTVSRENNDIYKASTRMAIANIYFENLNRNELQLEKRTNMPYWLHEFQQKLIQSDVFVRDNNYIYALSGKTREHLSRAYKKFFHKTLNEAVIDLRINLACNLLQHTDMSVTDISFESGFYNLSTFHHHFKEKIHYSPNAYRNSNISSDDK